MMMHEPLHFTGLRGTLTRDASLARYTSWRAGGAADTLYLPADRDDLAAFLRQLPADEPLLVLGLGSNTLVRDGGLRGTVVVMHNPGASLAVADGMLYADAGVASPKLARFAALHDCAEAEFLAGIPGTVGGALAMNAGCYGGETWNHVVAVETIDREGEVRLRTAADYVIGYRHVELRAPRAEWFLSGVFAWAPGDESIARGRMKELLSRRVASQPLNEPNAGSVFRNPEGDHAARLIEACGLKGHRIGGAEVSRRHSNFIVNAGGASAADIEALVNHVQSTVQARTGVLLEREVRIVGERA